MHKPASFKPITNRATPTAGEDAPKFALPDDGMVQIVPLGAAPNIHPQTGKAVLQVVDRKALESILNHAHAAGGEMLVDFDHLSHDPDKETIAGAWSPLAQLELRDDGIYGPLRLTNAGRPKIEGGDYRYLSCEYDADECEVISDKVIRPTRLVGLAFTNRPAFKMGKPLTNSAKQTETTNTDKMNIELLKLLDLDEGADDAAAIAKVKALLEKANKTDALNTEVGELRNREVAAILEQHKDVLPDEAKAKEALKGLLLTNRESAMALIEGYKAAAETSTKRAAADERAGRKSLFNRETAAVPNAAKTGDKADQAEAVVRLIKNRDKCTYQAAHAAARLERPELFTE